jgi:hypothetical protein
MLNPHPLAPDRGDIGVAPQTRGVHE